MNAFVDCGAFRGKTIKRFLERPEYTGQNYKCFAFECNPSLSYIQYPGDTTVIRKAVWTADCDLEFFLSKKKPDFVEGSSVYREKTTGNLDRDKPCKVQAIDFSRWLAETFNATDTVIVKMNIEGAEYNVLPKLLDDGTIKLIDLLIIQWHWQKVLLPQVQHMELVQRIKNAGVKMSGYKGVLK